MESIKLQPWDRWAVIGKNGSGKTAFSVLLAFLLSKACDPRWRIVWIDTKGDQKDLARLAAWGFRKVPIEKLGTQPHQLVWVPLAPRPNLPVNEQAQRISRWAIDRSRKAKDRRSRVILVYDEYVQVIFSSQNPGPDIKDVHQRGRGLFVGSIGETQDPAYIPRYLMSQANHLVLFRCTLPIDIKRLREFLPQYDPWTMPTHGFWHCWLDGDGEWRLYSGAQDWLERLNLRGLLSPTAGP